MTTYFVASGGDNTDGSTWAKAYTSLAGALAVATTAGDVVVIQYNAVPAGDAELAADTTYTVGAGISIISASNDGAPGAYTPTAMGTANWIGNSTTNRGVTFTGGFAVYFYGLTVRTSGSTADSILFGAASGADYTLENCYLWSGNSSTSAVIELGTTTGVSESFVSAISCTFRFASASSSIKGGGALRFYGCDMAASAGTTPSALFANPTGNAFAGYELHGCDASNCTAVVSNVTTGHKTIRAYQCKIPASPVAAQTTYGNRSQVEFYGYDCSDGDNHYQFIYNNGIGELVVDAGVYVTADGAEYNAAGTKCSWKITTTASASFTNPFITPWMSVHNESTSLTPYVEALRKGSTTKYKESELWSDWMYKDTANVTTGRIDRADRGAIFPASTTDQTASSLAAGDWTGEDATNNAFMKLSPGTITPTEIGDLCVRICVGKASATDIYIDPKIRGL